MFQLPPELLAYWQRKDKPKASDQDIALLATFFEDGVPKPYADFISEYGYVVFSMDFTDSFDAVFAESGQTVVRQGSVAYIMTAERSAMAHELSTRISPGEGLPSFPSTYLPVGGDAGRGVILLERSPSAGRVWYWPDRDEPWGETGNTALGLVADDFHGFINGLREYQD